MADCQEVSEIQFGTLSLLTDMKLAQMTFRQNAVQQDRGLAGLAPSIPEAEDLFPVLAPVIKPCGSDKLTH